MNYRMTATKDVFDDWHKNDIVMCKLHSTSVKPPFLQATCCLPILAWVIKGAHKGFTSSTTCFEGLQGITFPFPGQIWAVF